MSFLRKVITIFVYVSGIAAALLALLINPAGTGYRFLPLLPFIYVIIYSLLLEPSALKKSIAGSIFAGIAYARYVIMPLIVALSGNLSYAYYEITDVGFNEKAIMLMTYELVAISMTLFLASKAFLGKSKNEFAEPTLTVMGYKPVFYALILLSAALPIIKPEVRSFFSFLLIPVSGGSRVSENLSTMQFIIRQVMITGIIMAFLMISERCYKKFRRTGSYIYVALALAAGLANIFIIVGERRSAQLYTAFACAYILIRQYKKYWKQIAALLLIGLLAVQVGMTVYKHLFAFSFGSYLSAIFEKEEEEAQPTETVLTDALEEVDDAPSFSEVIIPQEIIKETPDEAIAPIKPEVKEDSPASSPTTDVPAVEEEIPPLTTTVSTSEAEKAKPTEAARASLPSTNNENTLKGMLFSLSNIAQSYVQGPGNIAIALQMAREDVQDPLRILYDMGRSTVGISFLVKGTMLNSNEVFNSYIYGEYRSSGHILSSIGYGYIYLGFILAPLFSCALAFLSVLFERSMRGTSSLEVAYLLAFVIIRIQMTIFSNLTLALNMISTMFISLGLVYAVARIMKVYFTKRKLDS